METGLLRAAWTRPNFGLRPWPRLERRLLGILLSAKTLLNP